jgi:hypothetical protein
MKKMKKAIPASAVAVLSAQVAHAAKRKAAECQLVE